MNPRSTSLIPPHSRPLPHGERGKVGELNANLISDIKTFKSSYQFPSIGG
jgi:hypothetical protein